MFSRRSALSRSPNQLATLLGELRAASRSYLDLTISNPTRCDLPFDAGAIAGALADPRCLGYDPEPFGLPSAREAVAR